MTTFDDREQAFEKKYAHDAEMQFKASARRDKLLGLSLSHGAGRSGGGGGRRRVPQGVRRSGGERRFHRGASREDGRASGEGQGAGDDRSGLIQAKIRMTKRAAVLAALFTSNPGCSDRIIPRKSVKTPLRSTVCLLAPLTIASRETSYISRARRPYLS